MGKKRVVKSRTRDDVADMTTQEAEALQKLATNPEYEKYIAEHKKRMKRLEREAKGMNLYEPDYE